MMAAARDASIRSKKELESLLSRDPVPDDFMCGINSMPRMPRGIIKEIDEVVELARRFNEEVVRPYALEADRKAFEDPEYLPWELVEKANEWGFYSIFIPRIFGGKGISGPAALYFIEEIASECVGLANVIFVHYLGLAGIVVSWNMPLMSKILREVVEGEKTGEPCLISLAITEPDAGTDVEDIILVDKGQVSCYAEQVEGGYIVNGSKIFISMGHMSTWCCLVAYTDLRKPSENAVTLAVKTGTEGFSFGRCEKKMGQRICVASELVFEDCFIPDECVLADRPMLEGFEESASELIEMYIHYAVTVTRPGVGAFATGVARGAYEESVKFACETEVDGKPLIEYQWVQVMLAEMYKNVLVARLSYLEAYCASTNPGGLFELMNWKAAYGYMKYTPKPIFNVFVSPFLNLKMSSRIARKTMIKMRTLEAQKRASGWASLSKVVCSDIAVKNCQMALELVGQAGLRHDRGMEKRLRDAKLLQIYEGTNQLNRINLFDCLIGRTIPEAEVFED